MFFLIYFALQKVIIIFATHLILEYFTRSFSGQISFVSDQVTAGLQGGNSATGH